MPPARGSRASSGYSSRPSATRRSAPSAESLRSRGGARVQPAGQRIPSAHVADRCGRTPPFPARCAPTSGRPVGARSHTPQPAPSLASPAAWSVRIPGFRPGRIPPRVIDQRVGRGAVLEQAVNDAVPHLYGKALEEHEVFALGQPDLEITKLDDGKELAFTAEVDVRPKFDIPELAGMPVTVDDAEVTPDQVEEYIGALRERFASLKGADRPVGDGDYVSIDLSAGVDGKQVDDAQASGISYEVGSGSMLDGLDDALAGMAAGDTKTFTAELAGGKLAGMQAEVTVTVHSVKVKELPELDDE